MARCELAQTCPFFNDKLAIPNQTAVLFKARYCKGKQAECARYKVFLAVGRDEVPFDLAPNDMMRARRIVHAPSQQANREACSNNSQSNSNSHSRSHEHRA